MVDSDHVCYVCVKSMLPSSGARRSRYTRNSVHPGLFVKKYSSSLGVVFLSIFYIEKVREKYM